MSELKEFDNTITEENEYETPWLEFIALCKKHNIFPELDVAANSDNTKCDRWIEDAMYQPWTLWEQLGTLYYRTTEIVPVWCNPPHTKTEEFVRRAYDQWKIHNMDIMMIIPTNTMSSNFWHDCIEDIAEYHAIKSRIRFYQNGKPSPNCSRNAYVCVIWKKSA